MSWLEALKLGDKVIMANHSWRCDKIYCVKRLTSTLIILENDARFRKKDGYRVSETGWYKTRIIEYTEKLAEKIRHNTLLESIRSIVTKRQFEEFSFEKLVRIKKEIDNG